MTRRPLLLALALSLVSPACGGGGDGGTTPTPQPTASAGAPYPATPLLSNGLRNKYKWPFASDSIWNAPIGSGARYVLAGIAVATAMGARRLRHVEPRRDGAGGGARAGRRHSPCPQGQPLRPPQLLLRRARGDAGLPLAGEERRRLRR